MKNLESLEAWKIGREVAKATYRLTMQAPLERHYAVSDQLRRAALSVPANVAEGYALGTRQQLVRCLRIALGSAVELKGHLSLVAEVGLVPDAQVGPVLSDADRVVGLLVGLLRRLGAKVPLRRS